MRRVWVPASLALAALIALFSPAVPALLRYGALPRSAERPLNVLLAGVDVDYDYAASTWPYPAKVVDYRSRTDTLMLAQVFPNGQVNLLSIPRDTWVELPGWGWGKINGANVHGGPKMMVETVQFLTAQPIDGYVYLSLSAVRDLTEAAGGVRLNVTQRMKYDDNAGHLHIDLQPGLQRLDGAQAEGYLRFRKDNLGDIGRVQRQQAFMKALGQQIKQPLNWWRTPAMIAALHRNTRSNLEREQVAGLLSALLKGPQISPYTVPGRFGRSGSWVPDRQALSTLISQQFRDPQDPRAKRIVILNVSAPAGSARRLKDRLEALGYEQVFIQDAPRHEQQTTISGPGAERVRQDLGFGQISTEGLVSGAEITIRLGNDTR